MNFTWDANTSTIVLAVIAAIAGILLYIAYKK